MLQKAKNDESELAVPSLALTWLARICFAIVFAWNVQCALSFILDPAGNAGSFQLSGVEGDVAIRGMGVAFLMWNVTYPLFIWQPKRFEVLGWVIIAQQTVGLVGELWIASTIPAGNIAIMNSISRFVGFDAVGLVLMATAFALLTRKTRVRKQGEGA